MKISFLKKIYKLLISLKIAVFIILAIGILSAVGTVIEAKYDAKIAQLLVYHSPYMFATLSLLCITLFLVMVDRWPWKKRHTGFVMAHIGILVLLIGSYITYLFGIDGSLYFENGEKTNRVTVADSLLSVYASFGDNYTELFKKSVDFVTNAPTETEPFVIQLGQKKLKIIDYWHFAVRDSKLMESKNKKMPPAVRFQIYGSRANSTQWLALTERKRVDQTTLGPLSVVFTKEGQSPFLHKYKPSSNHILFTLLLNGKMKYEIYSKSLKKITKTGFVKLGDEVVTGFMDFKIRLLNFYPHYEERITYKNNEFPNDYTKPALKIDFNGEKKWMGKNAVLKYFVDKQAYVLTFRDRTIDLDFTLTLKKFILGKYQGTQRAASYASDVLIDDKIAINISMNEPLKYKGFTFYQASFEKDNFGRPVASILSVNKDPGRALKYIGSLLIVLGSMHLFYYRKFKQQLKGSKKND